MQPVLEENIYTGLVNFNLKTSWLNSVMQLLWHSGVVSELLDHSETVSHSRSASLGLNCFWAGRSDGISTSFMRIKKSCLSLVWHGGFASIWILFMCFASMFRALKFISARLVSLF